MTRYRHTQPGVIGLVLFPALVVAFAAVGFLTGWPALLLLPVGVLVLAAIPFASLTTEIVDGELRCSFGPGLIRRRIPLDRIESAEPARNRWWYGWGIRWTPHGWMFNVSGMQAVQLRLASGGRFRIGTDRPEELTRAIREAIAVRGRAGC